MPDRNGHHPSPAVPAPVAEAGPARGWSAPAAALGLLTLVAVALCAAIAYPFLPALTWGLALAVIAYPMHRFVSRLIGNGDWAAGVTTALVMVVLVGPVVLLVGQLTREAAAVGERAKTMVQEGKVEEAADRVPQGRWMLDRAKEHLSLDGDVTQLVGRAVGPAYQVASGTAWAVVQLLVAGIVVYFAFRDRDQMLAGLRGVLPVTPDEAELLFRRVGDSVHATVYGTFVTGILQGVTGGLLFWALGLPAPVLWGVVMTALAVIPVLGAFLVWVPAAASLAVDGQWGEAAILVTWGLLMAGPVCNWLYAKLAGDRMRVHPVPALVAFVGGLVVFGVAGMVLGPVVLAVTTGLLAVWHRRMAAVDSPATAADRRAAVVVG